ncbi:MAG: flagellar FlbD family protein [bacterium]|nr:endoflagellar protein [Gemmatimonas sp.]MDO9170346.1 flagellar FlbD family protein [bacterium]
MISVTRLDGSGIVVNAELIEFVERTPDTMIGLTTGRLITVREPVEEIVRQVLDYRRRTRSH